MCLLSFFPRGVEVNAEHLHNGCTVNRDGFGFAIADHRSGRLITEKSMEADYLVSKFADMRAAYPDCDALFHSRFTTGGRVDESNCHPFKVGSDNRTVLAHNGILFTTSETEPRSDTRIFAEDIMPRQYKRLDRPTVHAAIEKRIGSYNKFVILTVNPRYRNTAYLYNEKAGQWTTEGAWHSNADYKGWKRFGPVRSYVYGGDDWDQVTGPDALDTGVNCPECMTMGSVDMHSLMCYACDTCYDCGQHYTSCQCYTPDKYKPAVLSITAGPSKYDGFDQE